MATTIRFQALVKTTAEIEADKFAGRVGWSTTLARYIVYYNSTQYAQMARRDVLETFVAGLQDSTLGVGLPMFAGTSGRLSTESVANFRSRIAAVNKAGDTMTGGLTLSAGNLNVGAGAIQTAGVTRISSGGAGTLTTLSTTGMGTLNSLKVTAEAGTGNRLVQAGADGTNSATIPVPTAFIQTLFDDVDQATARTTLGAAASVHSHTIADVTGLQGALDARMGTASYPDLVAIEALAGTSGLLRKTAANTWSLDPSAYLTAPNVKEIYNWYSYSSRPTDCNLAPNGNGGLRSFKAASSMTANKPPQGDSHIIHLDWDSTAGWDSQIAISDAGQIQTRGQNSGTWNTWRTIYDSVNLPTSALGKSILNGSDAASIRSLIGAAPTSHTHTISNVSGLQSALDAKQDALGYTPVNRAGDTMTGALTLSAGSLNVNAGAIQTAGVTRISSGGAGTLTTLSTTGMATLAQATVSDLATGRMVSTTTGGRLQALDAAGSRALIGAEEARQISSVGEFFSGTPYTLSIGTKKKIELWLYSSYGGTGGVITIAPSGGGSVSLNFTGWYARMTIVFDKYNSLIVDSQLGVTHVASGESTSITFSSTNPSGQGWKITRCELSD